MAAGLSAAFNPPTYPQIYKFLLSTTKIVNEKRHQPIKATACYGL